ncbi:MAG: GTPase [Verrucomicrobiota bacterium]
MSSSSWSTSRRPCCWDHGGGYMQERRVIVLVAVNKVDTLAAEAQATEFTQLGFEKIFPVTAIHGEGIDALMTEAVRLLPAYVPEATETEVETTDVVEGAEGESLCCASWPGPLKLAIVGCPKVGKSSIINALTKLSVRFRARRGTRWMRRLKSKPMACGRNTF